ncbi:Cna B-type domain-containing protein [Streptococcus caballi]|uniref:Cna B-type domain-containing protein n=1 Tax=Streptococcus caballi TaxID=439220 RepID=UPI000373DB09|nr:Cna B-type domain-containing protein [Streptococcus caballi]
MKKKVLSSILLTILLVSSLSAPVVTALDASGSSEPPSSIVQQNDTKAKVSIEAMDRQTQAVVTDVAFVLKDKETGQEISKWTSSDAIKELELDKNRTYLLEAVASNYEDVKDRELKLDQDSKVYLLQDDKTWQEQASAKVSLPLSPKAETAVAGDGTASGETQTMTVTLPAINVYNADDESDENYPASFRLRKDGEGEDLATWLTGDGQPTVTLEVGTVYTIEESAVYGFEDSANPVKIRLAADGSFEEEKDGEWKSIETIKIPIKKVRKLRRVLRAAVNGIISPTKISDGDIAPMNLLQVVKKMPETSKVSIIGQGSAFDYSWRVQSPPYTQLDNRMHAGQYQQQNNNQLDPNIADAAGDHGALIVRFKPSVNPNTWGNDYQTNPNTGWNSRDLNMNTSEMWVKVRYSDAAYYDGKLVDAIATIKVTPYKNRTPNSGDQTQYSTQPYYPLIQISDILFGGWTWQNVNKFNVDLKFVPRGGDESQAITFPDGNLNSKNAAYYTINSLDPLRTEGDWDRPRAVYGPESVRPSDGTTSGAYVVPNTNIKTSYNGGTSAGTQSAYNGGDTLWGTAANNKDQDTPGHPDWSKNSVLFTTASTNHINVTLGNLERAPLYQKVPRTNYVWATISTEAFTNNIVKYIDIPIQKNWSDPDNTHANVDVELYATWNSNNGQAQETSIQIQTLGKDNNWQTVFKQVPDQESLVKLIKKFPGSENATNVQYKVREINIPNGYQASYSGSTTGFKVTNTKVTTGLVITKKWFNQGAPLAHDLTRNITPKITVYLRRKVGTTIDQTYKQPVDLYFHRLDYAAWTKTVDNLPMRDSQNREYLYYIEEDPNTLPENYFIQGYQGDSNKGIALKPNTKDNQFVVSNDSYTTDLRIEKQWFKKDGTTRLRNENLPQTLKVRIYQTTNGGTSNGKLFDTVTLTRSGTADNYVWETTKKLPLRGGEGGKTYYSYYIEEDRPQGYLEISEASQKQLINTSSKPFIEANVSMTLKNKVNPVYPSTGGLGILPYLVLGIISLFTAVILYYMQKTERFLGGK